MLTELQRNILEFVKREYFHATIKDFINYTGVPEEDAISALKDLRKKRIVSVGPSLTDSFIGVNNYGWSIMGWK